MKTGFFRKTAWENIKKNYRFFIPKIIAEIGLIAVYFVVFTIKSDDRIRSIKGGDYVAFTMSVGVFVIALLSIILMFYTNSFLMKQRKKEFGLYNVLGMEKKHISRVLFFETIICTLISAFGGVVLGILMYKGCSLIICKLLASDIILGFYFLNIKNMLVTTLSFVIIDMVNYIFNVIKIKKMKPVEMLSSKSTGEKEPKVKCVMLILGILLLGGGYAISLFTQKPLNALLLFFVAVFMVIIGTYFLFVTGSIFVLKILKKNKKYYYNKKHMPAVSGLLYRMKQNAVGLASICILATGVLVMLSSTVSLYSGMSETLTKNYPQHLYINAFYNENFEQIPYEKIEKIIQNSAEKVNLKIKDIKEQEYLSVSYLWEEDTFYAKSEWVGKIKYSELSSFIFITQETYEQLTGEKLNLTGKEIATCRISSDISNIKTPEGNIHIHGSTYVVKNILTTFPVKENGTLSALGVYGVVVSSQQEFMEIYNNQLAAYGTDASAISQRCAVTFESLESAYEKGDEMLEYVFDDICNLASEDNYNISITADSVWYAKEDIMGMYGAFLFLGIILGAVCLFATVLIIYYKQISEGYEDRERFQIMEKIGMSREEVRKTINSQVLLVFLLPLIVSGIHLTFAFPILERLLHVFLLSRTSLFVICSIVTYLIFALVYVLIYSGTAKTYYKIVH